MLYVTTPISVNLNIQFCAVWVQHYANRPYAHDVISVGHPNLEVKRRSFIGQSCAPRVHICAIRLFRHRFYTKMAAG